MNLINQIKRKEKRKRKMSKLWELQSLFLSLYSAFTLSLALKFEIFTTRRSDDFFILSTLYIGKPKGENR